MSRIDAKLLDCSLYLYPHEADAKAGQQIGGSGFLLAVQCLDSGHVVADATDNRTSGNTYFVYAVSNRHVVEKSPVVRLNMHGSGSSSIHVIPFEEWHWSNEQDLAVTWIEPSDKGEFLSISTFQCVTREKADIHDIGIGDEVFMVGRFISHDGKQKNIPSVRFGRISMMPDLPVYHPSNANQLQESFLVEIHSVSGYSGSPVFARPFPTHKLPFESMPLTPTSGIYEAEPYYSGSEPRMGGPWLLGVDWGYINSHEQRDNNSGMSAVVPAWRLIDLLNDDKLVRERHKVMVTAVGD